MKVKKEIEDLKLRIWKLENLPKYKKGQRVKCVINRMLIPSYDFIGTIIDVKVDDEIWIYYICKDNGEIQRVNEYDIYEIIKHSEG
jgi:hypothetical protein